MSMSYTRAARTNPHKVHQHSTVRGRVIKNGTIALVSNPVKSDYPETTLENDDLVADLSAIAPNIPAKAVRTMPMNHTATIMSARSKRELRQLIQAQSAGAGVKVLSTIQVNDQGKYFVYVADGLSPTVLSTDECVEPIIHKIEDIITPVDDDCVVEVEQNVDDVVIPADDDCTSDTVNDIDPVPVASVATSKPGQNRIS